MDVLHVVWLRAVGLPLCGCCEPYVIAPSLLLGLFLLWFVALQTGIFPCILLATPKFSGPKFSGGCVRKIPCACGADVRTALAWSPVGISRPGLESQRAAAGWGGSATYPARQPRGRGSFVDYTAQGAGKSLLGGGARPLRGLQPTSRPAARQ